MSRSPGATITADFQMRHLCERSPRDPPTHGRFPHEALMSVPLAPPSRGISKGAEGPLGPPEGPFRAERQRSPVTSPSLATQRALGYAAMAIAVIVVGIPIYWMLLAAFKTNREIF